MKYKLDTNYSEDELHFIKKYKCEILSEIKLSKLKFTEKEIPQRIIRYGVTYIAQIVDDEDNQLIWTVLTKWRGFWHYSYCFETLEDMLEGL